MIGKCKAIAHGSNALEYIFREGKLGKTLLFHNLCGTTPKEIYEEMKRSAITTHVAGTSSCVSKSALHHKMRKD